MKKKIIIDLDGIIFEPIGARFAEIARRDYGPVKGALIIASYKYAIGRRKLSEDVAAVLYRSVVGAKLRAGALDALDKIEKIPGVSVEFCSQIAFPWQKDVMEDRLRAIAPCMDNVADYQLISPYESKKPHLYETTARKDATLNYVVDNKAHDFDWPSRWRSCPVLIYATAQEKRAARERYSVRSFPNLDAFAEFLIHSR